jgi:bifunctional non-homologous end joining protein LigD
MARRVIKRSVDGEAATVRSRALNPKPSRSQPDLFKAPPKRDPMPKVVEPCLATLVDTVPRGPRWFHEIKWDGYRLMAHLDRGKVRLITRRGHDWTERFPTIARALPSLGATTVILDGEAVVESDNGIPSFSALQAALGARSGPGHKAAIEAVYYAFDLLHLDGRDYRDEPLEARRAALASLMSVMGAGTVLRFSEHLEADGEAMFNQACVLGLEGIISKRRDLPYRSGRSEAWLKIKCTPRQEFVIAGYIPASSSTRAVGALVLGWYEKGELVHVGRVGTGFTERVSRELWATLHKSQIDKPPFPAGRPEGGAARKAVWVEPKLVAEVEFRGFTDDGLLRHASYKGLRNDKNPREVVADGPTDAPPEPQPARKPKAAPKRTAPAGEPLRFRPENVQTLYPDAVVPSRDRLAAYWRAVADKAIPYLARRPLKLVRSVGGRTFMHQGPLPPIPDAVHQLRIEKATGGEGTRVWVDSLDGLLGLVEMNVVEVHPWGATVDDIDHPDMLVLDIDPGEEIEWAAVTDTALTLKAAFESEGLKPWPKLSGSKGIHVMVPTDAGLGWNEARAFCKAVAERVAATDRRLYSTSARANRRGRIFLDYLRNVPSIAAIGTYSPRAKPEFPVAMKVSWREIERGIRSDAFTMQALIEASGIRRSQ